MAVETTAHPGEHPNRTIARRMWNAIAAADMDELCAVIAPKSVWRMYGEGHLGGSYQGIDEIIGFLASVGEYVDELQFDLVDIFVSDRGAVLRYTTHALRGDRVLDVEQLLQLRIDDGRVVEAVFAPIDQSRHDRFWSDPPARGRSGGDAPPTR